MMEALLVLEIVEAERRARFDKEFSCSERPDALRVFNLMKTIEGSGSGKYMVGLFVAMACVLPGYYALEYFGQNIFTVLAVLWAGCAVTGLSILAVHRRNLHTRRRLAQLIESEPKWALIKERVEKIWD